MENLLARSIRNPESISIRKMFLLGGFYSAIFYVVTDIIASLSYPGYSIADQNYSELLATGAPTRQWLLISSYVYNFLIAAFAITVWKTYSSSNLNRITGAIILGYAILSMVTPLFFQMDMRGADPTPRGSLHPPMTAIMSFFIVLSIGFGAFLLNRSFRIYSFITIAIVIIFGLLTSAQIPQLAAGQVTPWMGLTERVNIYLTMLWFGTFSLGLLKKEEKILSAHLEQVV